MNRLPKNKTVKRAAISLTVLMAEAEDSGEKMNQKNWKNHYLEIF